MQICKYLRYVQLSGVLVDRSSNPVSKLWCDENCMVELTCSCLPELHMQEISNQTVSYAIVALSLFKSTKELAHCSLPAGQILIN